MRFRFLNLILILSLIIALSACSSSKQLFETDPELIKPAPFMLKLQANSTIRNQDAVLNIHSAEKASYTDYSVITVFNESGRDAGAGELRLPYDSFRELEYVNVQVRNDQGTVTHTYTIDDFNDYSTSFGSFFSDVRVKVLPEFVSAYPFTLEYEYSYTFHGTLNLPGWYPKKYNQSVEKASFEIRDYTGGNMRYLSRNMDESPAVSEMDNYKSIKWVIENELAVDQEVYSPHYSGVLPNIMTSVNQFRMENVSGNATSWESFGKWYHTLIEGKRDLPESAKTEIDALLQGTENEREKVEILYKYMQDKVRYVSIQLGLGGWEPFSAAYVFERSYGDCKALVNFMQALLEYAGIEAKPALIRRGIHAPQVVTEFPSNQFNHVVLRVTLSGGEVVWLECTSKYYRPGHLGPDNEGKNVLLVSAEGGELDKTPVTGADQNQVLRKGSIELKPDGSAGIKYNIDHRGVAEDLFFSQLKPVSEEKRKEWLNEFIPLSDYKLLSYSFLSLDDDQPETAVDYTFEITANDYISTSGKRLFVPLNRMEEVTFSIPKEGSRLSSIHLPYRITETDSVTYHLPEGYEPESVPGNAQVETSFGSYKFSIDVLEDRIVYTSRLIIDKAEIPEEQYSDFQEFTELVNHNNNNRFVLVRKEN